METPISVVLIILVTLTVFSAAFYFLYPQLTKPPAPVSMNVPGGQVVYRDRNVYYIPVQISVRDGAPPIRICRVNIRFMDVDLSNTLRSENVDLTYAQDGRPVYFPYGSIRFQNLTITRSFSQTITISFNDRYHLVSLYVYYCVLGENTPKWGEELRIPGTHLTP